MKPAPKLGPWPLGIDNVSDKTSLKADDHGNDIALVDAVNVDVDRNGRPSRRRGRVLSVSMADLHSVWSCALGTFGVAGSTLYSVTASELAPVATLNSGDRCSYAVLNDAVVVSSRTTLLSIKAGIATPLGVSGANEPSAAPDPAGGLVAGRYSIAVSFLRAGVEGGLSLLRSVTLTDGQGIRLTNLPTANDADTIRIYRTRPGGEMLYRVAQIALGLPSFLIGAGPTDIEADTQHLARLPPGEFAAAWRGRLLTANGRTLCISEPMRYGLFSPRHGFTLFPQRIDMIGAVDGGVFVGTRDGVVFLRGDRPKEWKQESTGALPPLRGQPVPINGNILNPGLQQGGKDCIAWLAPNGFVIGTAEGQIIEPQADRLILRGNPQFASIVVHGRRLTAAIA